MRWNKQPKLTPALGGDRRRAPARASTASAASSSSTSPARGATIEGLRMDVGASAGKLSNPVLQPNPLTKGVRASFELDPADADVVELRLRLMRADKPVTETWLYRWTAS